VPSTDAGFGHPPEALREVENKVLARWLSSRCDDLLQSFRVMIGHSRPVRLNEAQRDGGSFRVDPRFSIFPIRSRSASVKSFVPHAVRTRSPSRSDSTSRFSI
jgi:hypothetical protein